MTKKELAKELRAKNYNCAQAVACAFAEEAGVDMATMLKVSEGFGAGCGNMEGFCGALSGAIMVASFIKSDGNTEAPKTKATTYKYTKEMMAKFEEKTGGLVCKVLKGTETGKMLCSCPDCIMAGVEVTEEVLGH